MDRASVAGVRPASRHLLHLVAHNLHAVLGHVVRCTPVVLLACGAHAGDTGRTADGTDSPLDVGPPAAQQVAYAPAGPYYGRFAAGVGDVDRDGYDDIAMITGTTARDAQLRVHRGTAAGLAQEWSWTLPVKGWLHKATVLGADLEGDGVREVILAGDNLLEHDDSHVVVWSMRPEGPTEAALAQPVGHSRFGADVAVWEAAERGTWLAVGAPFEDHGRGAVYVYAGDAWRREPTVRIAGIGEGELVGEVFDHAGDVDGDGKHDLVVRRAPTGSDRSARVALLRGPDFALPGSAWTLTGPTGNPRWAEEVVGVGDMNGDGFADVVVATPTVTLEAELTIVLGGPSGWSQDVVVLGVRTWIPAVPLGGDDTGIRVAPSLQLAALGDVTGDGLADLGVGYIGEDDEGHVLVFAGSAEGIQTTPYTTLSAAREGVSFGLVMDHAGDLNGDARGDMLVWAADPLSAMRGGVLHLWFGPLDAEATER
jgi:hypothetical protein